MEHCLVYFRRWQGPFQENELIATLEQSRRHNAIDGITRVTLYVRGTIIQVIEGQPAAVEALFQRIQQDQPHTNIVEVVSRPISQRLFSGSALA